MRQVKEMIHVTSATLTIHQSYFFFQAEDGIRDYKVTGVQTCALPICHQEPRSLSPLRLEDRRRARGRAHFRDVRTIRSRAGGAPARCSRMTSWSMPLPDRKSVV